MVKLVLARCCCGMRGSGLVELGLESLMTWKFGSNMGP